MWQQHLGISFRLFWSLLCRCHFLRAMLYISVEKVFPVVVFVPFCTRARLCSTYFIPTDTTNGINMWWNLPPIRIRFKLWKIDIFPFGIFFLFIFRSDPVHSRSTAKKEWNSSEWERWHLNDWCLHIWEMSTDEKDSGWKRRKKELIPNVNRVKSRKITPNGYEKKL